MRYRGFSACFSSLLLVLAFAATAGWSQSEKRLSAREVFYSAPSESTSDAKRAAPKQPAVKKQAPAESAKSKPPTPNPVASPRPSRAPQDAKVVAASHQTEASYPLGIRYSILKREGASSTEISPDVVFRAGDRIRLRVEANDNGFLYIVHRGSSGVWKPLFPSSQIAEGSNRIEKGKSYEIPSGYVFTFDEQAGEEKLFIVLSRQPETDLEKLIYSLSGGPKQSEPAASPEGKALLAQNLVNIGDGVVNQLRNAYARDLIIEKVDETTPPTAAAPPMEKAVYVVNPVRSNVSRVVADVSLDHK
jgi:hypothetical protein